MFQAFPASPASAPRGVEVADRDSLAFVANAVNGDNTAAFYIEPQHSRVQFADVAQLIQTVTQRFGQWLAVILPVAQLRQPPEHCSMVAGVAGFEFVQKLPHRRTPVRSYIKLYCEIHNSSTSILMFMARRSRPIIAGTEASH
jgi:hypothetical protein